MVYSSLTNAAYVTSQKSSRGGAAIDRFIDHHAVSTSWQSVLNLMMGAKEVSANYIIGNGGEIISVVPEEYRAWTSGSAAWDGRAITVEVCNESLAPGYTISAAAQESLAKLKADVSRRYGFPLTRNGSASTVIGHRELYSWYGASYATACPGGLPIDSVTARANVIKDGAVAAAQPTTQEDPMYNLSFRTDGAGMLTSIFGVSGVPTQQLYILLYRVRNSNQLATPFVAVAKNWTPNAQPGVPDTLLPGEYDLVSNFLRLHRAAASAAVTIDDAKLRSALSDALKKDVNWDTVISDEELSKVATSTADRVIAAINKK